MEGLLCGSYWCLTLFDGQCSEHSVTQLTSLVEANGLSVINSYYIVLSFMFSISQGYKCINIIVVIYILLFFFFFVYHHENRHHLTLYLSRYADI